MKLFMKLRIMVTLWDGLEMPFDGKLSIIADCGVERIPVNIGSGVGIYGEPVVTVPDPAGVSDSLLQIFKKMGPDYIEPGAYALLLHFAHSEIETFSISFQQHKMQGLTIDLDDLVGTLLKAYFQEEGNAFGIGLPSFGVYLPDMDKIPENRFYADLAAIKVVNGQALAVAFNFLGRSGGNADDLSDFLRNCSIGLAIPEAAVNRLIAFGWERVVKGKVMDFQKRITVDKTNSTFNTISSALNIVDRVAAELATLGILEVEYDLKCLKIDIGLSVCIPTQPRFDMMPGNIVAIGDVFAQVYLTAKVTVEAELDVEVDLTGWLPDFIPDIKAYHEHQKICVLNARVRLDKVGFTDMKAKVVFDAVGNRIAWRYDHMLREHFVTSWTLLRMASSRWSFRYNCGRM